MKHKTKKELKKAYEKDQKCRIGKVMFLAALTIDRMKSLIDNLKTELAVRTKENDNLKKQIASCENALRFKERTADSLQIERDAWRKTAELSQKEKHSIANKRSFWRCMAICLIVCDIVEIGIRIALAYNAK